VNKTHVSKISLLLLGLLRQDVTFERMFPFDFSCSGKGKPLFGTGISLHFWHFAVFEFVNIIFSFLRGQAKKFAKLMILSEQSKHYPFIFIGQFFPGELCTQPVFVDQKDKKTG